MKDNVSGESAAIIVRPPDVAETSDGATTPNVNDYLDDATRNLDGLADFACDDLEALNSFIFLCGAIDGALRSTKLRLGSKEAV
jgi:hypothetical protein